MNDLRIHDRLANLADDLAPDADPRTQADGARALHRRQRRTRIGVAGAAVAVALVAVGVPTAVGSLSTPERADVALPNVSETPTPAGPTGDGSLGRVAEDLRAGLTRVGPGPVPGTSEDLPCPDAADALSRATGMLEVFPASFNATSSAVKGCQWSSVRGAVGPGRDRLDLVLVARPETGAEDALTMVEESAAHEGCDWARPLDGDFFNALLRCTGPDRVEWTLFMVDEDGAGTWQLTTAVGAEMPEGYGLGLSGTTSLWGAVLDLSAAEPVITPMNQDLIDVVDTLAARPEPVALETTGEWACTGATGELTDALGTQLTEGPVLLSLPSQPLCWWAAGPVPNSEEEMARTVRLAIDFRMGTDAADHEAMVDTATQQVTAPSGRAAAQTCLSADPFTSPERVSVLACSLDGHTEWTVVAADRAGEGLWVLSAAFPPGTEFDQSTAVLALVDVADRIW